MGEPRRTACPVEEAAPCLPLSLAGVDRVLAALQAEGLHRCDPARFHYLQVLAARLPAQPPAVQALLVSRFGAAAADYTRRARARAGEAIPSERVTAPGSGAALAQLNRELRARVQAEADPMEAGSGSMSELRSVRRFGAVWSALAAEKQVTDALARGPHNAGPLNSHRLVLRCLALMRTLSPRYLQRFLSQMDTLAVLEQMTARPPRAAARPVRRTRPKP